MHYKKGIFISLMSLSLLFGSSSVSLADETSVSMSGMDMGGKATTHTEPVAVDPHDSSSPDGHEAAPDMDPNMEGMMESSKPSMSEDETNSNEHGEVSEGHGEATGGHGESGETSEDVSWTVVGGFSAINLLVIITAGLLKFLKKPQLEV